jgi:teichoic acid transport system permease protein
MYAADVRRRGPPRKASMTTSPPRAAGHSALAPDVHVYEPHRAGLPPLRPYVREVWRRRHFATELSRAQLRAANSETFFGQVWLVLSPLLLASVYFVLVNVLTAKPKGWTYFSHLTGGLFVFYFVSSSLLTGAASVTGAGKLLLNTAFPRMLMPMSAVRTAFFRFLPTVPVYLCFHLIARNPWSWVTPLALVFLFLINLFALGLAAVFSTMQVYFRDTSSFLPYFVRIWLYLSPVILLPEQLHKFGVAEYFNPLFSLIGGYTDLLVRSKMPDPLIWLLAVVWSVGALLLGSWFFVSRERDFAVRV